MYQCVSGFGGVEGIGLLVSLFLAGLVGGFLHCTVMCGPFVLAMQQGRREYEGAAIGKISSSLLLPYHAGRLTTYILLGVLANLLLSSAFLSSSLRQILSAGFLFLAGLLFLSLALPGMLKFLPFLSRLTIPVPLRWVERLSRPILSRKTSPQGLYGLGVLLGFMPCGLIMASLLAVAALSNPWEAAAGMGLFAIGTVPGLIAVALGGQALATIYPTTIRVLTMGLMMLNSIILFALAGKLIS
jgi:sulfite exporter TauE/SafE